MGKVIFPPFEHTQSGSLTAILIVGSEDCHVYSALRDVRLDQQESFLQLLPNCMRHNSVYNPIIASNATARTKWMRDTILHIILTTGDSGADYNKRCDKMTNVFVCDS